VAQEVQEWIGQSTGSAAILRVAARAAASDANVLMIGERGVGKELLARRIHADGKRAGGPFIAIHCGALDQVALMTELFGSEIGSVHSWTAPVLGQLERAAEGVVYLEEISALGSALQARLSRALAERWFEPLGSAVRIPLRARLMAGVTTDLRREVESGRFDERLFYEFGAIVEVSSLRQRADDILILATHYLQHFAHLYERAATRFSEEALELLLRYDWPGNVRQLRNMVERAVVNSSGEIIEPGGIAAEIKGWEDSIQLDQADGISLDAVERRHIRRVLQLTGGRISEAADILGIHRNTLRRKLEQYRMIPEG
jgi:DNA-binding NtrC family response regulator